MNCLLLFCYLYTYKKNTMVNFKFHLLFWALYTCSHLACQNMKSFLHVNFLFSFWSKSLESMEAFLPWDLIIQAKLGYTISTNNQGTRPFVLKSFTWIFYLRQAVYTLQCLSVGLSVCPQWVLWKCYAVVSVQMLLLLF